MRMDERVKVGVAAATLAPGRTGYTDIQLECVQFRMPPKYPASKDSQVQLLTITTAIAIIITHPYIKLLPHASLHALRVFI